ncbi:hypothetical protein [Roseomonas sp. HF4]|uniref:hypothetical protein n=1 Tax=Roseomonas sp. HF4 TaxID=2562313 RepID=UPI0010BF8B9C|nr:hypothetical protein [Roseomonas sp. HF4]
MRIIATALVFGAAVALPATASDPLAGLEPIGVQELAGTSGRAGLDIEAANQALLRDTHVGANSATGSNMISGSLNGNAGITTVFQNTGNNTILQSATTVTVNMR